MMIYKYIYIYSVPFSGVAQSHNPLHMTQKMLIIEMIFR